MENIYVYSAAKPIWRPLGDRSTDLRMKHYGVCMRYKEEHHDYTNYSGLRPRA